MLSLFNELFNDLRGIRTECTMAMGKFVCDLYVEKNGQRWKKAPKLSELHFQLFGTIPDNLHDALVDTTACLNCYLQMSRGGGNLRFAPIANLTTKSSIPSQPSLP